MSAGNSLRFADHPVQLLTDSPDQVAAIWWVRRDLRLADNPALAAALEHARAVGGKVLAVFVFDADILGSLPDREDRRVAFIAGCVQALEASLRERAGGLLVGFGSARMEIPRMVRSLGRVPVFAGGDHEPFGLARDREVRTALESFGSSLHVVSEVEVVPAGTLKTSTGSSFRVFTPYHRTWTLWLERSPEVRLGDRGSVPRRGEMARVAKPVPPPRELLESLGFAWPDSPVPQVGEDAARGRFQEFLRRLDSYPEDRDQPSLQGTSGLSVDLRFGTISARSLVRAARESESPGAAKWISELAWRDFYQDILHRWPGTVEHAFQERMERVAWDDPEDQPEASLRWEAWKEGRTGYPFVDAAMRELATTGRMHNRCRMVVASFLTKDLHIHWKRGERWFARHLLDIELASNVGGWQWAASTGADGQPWFRIFNPVEQGRRWDAQGDWTRRWCPELGRLPARWIHAPWMAPAEILRQAGVVLGETWPLPVVDHARERGVALERFGRC
ncbi:MAG: deoxyribodipyrimidine photo-lyase [Fibrobacteria bacterium]|nr:deoxyribodipyrimidine photo-lyase [Fibrobacteria bacterium]